MNKIKDDNYCLIQGWMLNIGCSNWNEIAAYALIYGFSQDGQTKFKGSIAYIQEWLMCCKQTALTTLKKLEEKGLIEKTQYEINGVTFNEFSATKRGSLNFRPPVQILDGGSLNFRPNNNINNRDVYNNSPLRSELSYTESAEKNADDEFEKFWKLYDKKVERTKCERLWSKLSKADKQKIFERLPEYIQNTPDKQYRKNPSTYLNPREKRWLDEIIHKNTYDNGQLIEQHQASDRRDEREVERKRDYTPFSF